MLLTVRGSQAVNWFSQQADGIFNSAYGHTVLLTVRGSQAVCQLFSQRADGSALSVYQIGALNGPGR